MHIKLEANTRAKLHQLESWAKTFPNISRAKLLTLATDPNQNVKNINVRAVALYGIQRTGYLMDCEIPALFNLVTNEKDFPILVDEKELEDDTKFENKRKYKRDIEENDAVIRGIAANMLVEHALKNRRKYSSLINELIPAIREILNNMIGEPVFVEVEHNQTSSLFMSFLTALYLIDKRSAREIMSQFNINQSELFLKPQKKSS